MPTVVRASGVEINLPAAFRVADSSPAPATRQRGAPPRRFGPVPMPAGPPATDALALAFRQQDMDLVDSIGVEADAGAGQMRALPGDATLDLNVPLAPQEDAAVLLEQEGLYTWHFATETATTTPAGEAVRGSVMPVRQARFRLPLAPRLGEEAALQRGFMGEALRSGVRAFVFKFAARVAVGQAMKFLERKVRRGLVRMEGADPAAWDLLGAVPLTLPANRPARVLLFVHGTFSSTVGAYAALTATPWGREFLAAAQTNYDAVLGFDHATLSEDPLENATELLTALQGIPWAQPPRFDVVTHSRGGLVLRSLLEHLLPLTSFAPRVERVVFVGVTNGGTLLAEPANWQALVDLYTNLAMGAAQLLGLLLPAKAVATVLEELVRGLGAFVKYCATTAVTDRLVPGLAAMAPSGDFIRHLNEDQPRQPTIAQSYYCAVTSEFRPRVVGGDHEPRELPARVLAWLGSGFMQALMREGNDLVVNTAAMTQIDPAVGNYLKDILAFGPNPQVYHTNYFVQPRVINALTRWLQLTPPAGPVPAPRTGATAGSAATPRRAPAHSTRAAAWPVAVAPGSFVEAPLPAAVDLDVYVTTADATVEDALAAVRAAHPSYVVVRHFAGNQPHDYAFTAEDLLGLARYRPQHASLYTALRLASTPCSAVLTAGASLAQAPLAPAGLVEATDPPPLTEGEVLPFPVVLATPGTHAVVLRQGRPAGVLPPAAALPDGPALAALARKVTAPRRDEEFILRRRAMPTFSDPLRGEGATSNSWVPSAADRGSILAATTGTRPTRPRKTPSGAGATNRATPAAEACHFRAEMDQQVDVGRPTTLEIVVSREALDRAVHAAAAVGSAAVAPGTPLLVEVLPKVNFEYVEPAAQYRRELPPPVAGEAPALYFTLRATHPGEGEVWVLVRQGQVPLLTLCLRPQVVSARAAGVIRRVQVGATTAAVPPTAAVHQLIIMERRNGAQLSYHFQLQLPGLGVLQWGETQPFVGDRQTYVTNLYQEIENRWVSTQADRDNFTAELRALGGALFDELIPAELQRLLWQHRRAITSILVIAEEPFIPWELVHLHAPGRGLGRAICFLGQLGLVRWLHEAGWPREQLYLRPGKSRYVIPHYPHPDYVLPEAEAEEDFLREALGAKAVLPNAQAVRTLLGRPGAFDLLHFACHGDATHDNIANAQLLLQGRVEGAAYLPEYFSATTAEQYSNFGTHAPIIVLNACQAGRTGYRLTGVGGFAQSFLRRGAGAFIGTLWAVGDAPARTFTEALYRQLLDGATLAEATTAAREQARQAGDATWLAYAVYGHPYARVTQ